MRKKLKLTLFLIGLAASLIGMPYLLGFSTNEILKYPLYGGLIVVVLFAPIFRLKKVSNSVK